MKELLSQLETKVGVLSIYRMTADDKPREFYADMGNVFASPEIRKDMDGYPVSNIPGRQWIVAFDGQTVVGFRSFDINEDTVVYRDAWVDEIYRNNGLYTRMLETAETLLSMATAVKRIKAIGNPKAAPILQKHGFVVTSMRGRFAYLEKEIVRDV